MRDCDACCNISRSAQDTATAHVGDLDAANVRQDVEQIRNAVENRLLGRRGEVVGSLERTGGETALRVCVRAD